MNDQIPGVNYSGSSFFSDESDLASDIEADLQELTVEGDDFESTTAFSLHSSSPFTGSFSSLLSSDTGDDASSTHSAPNQSFQQQQQSYFHLISLKSIHTQLLNAGLKENCGLPSCISLQFFIVVGTNNGFIFVFDRRQKLVFSIDTGATEVGSGQGPITCLSQNISSTRLLVGFASGRITMWQLPKGNAIVNDEIVEDVDENLTGAIPDDFKSKKQKSPTGLLRIIDDAHHIGQSMIVCAFASLPTVAVAMDSSGSAYEMDFRRGLIGRSTQSFCFFSGSHGEICAISPLRPTHTSGLLQKYQHHPAFGALLGSAMVAMASFTKVIVVVLKPKFRVVFWQHLKGSPSCLPQLTWSWCFSETQVSQSSGESNAYLGFARISTFYVARITTSPLTSSAEVPSGACVFGIGGRQFMHRIQLLRSISIEQRIVSMHFFTLDHLAFLDAEESLRLYDVSTDQEVESLNLSTTQICYNSSAFKALAIGGKVSEALARASERACANSIASSGGKLLILGKSGITLISLKSWTERAISLFKAGRPEEALTCCCQALKEGSLMSIKESLLQILSHMPLAQAKRRPTLSTVSSLVAICVTADLRDFLQSSVIPVYRQDALTYPLLLRCLCQYLLTLPPIYSFSPNADVSDCCLRFLTPDVTMEMLTWCVNGPAMPTPLSSVKGSSPTTNSPTTTSLDPSVVRKSSLQRVENGPPLAESCLFRFSPVSLDIDKVLKFCISNGLYQGFIYIYAFVLKDHEAAFRWLADLLIKRVHSPFERKISFETRPNSLHSTSSSADSLENLNTTEAVNAILLFLRSSFAGEEVFGIPLDPNHFSDVPDKVFNLLLSSQVSSPQQCEKLILSQPDSAITCTAPRLRVLLHFGSTVDLLNMLTLALRESEFFAGNKPSSTNLSCQRRQRLLTTLMACALDELGQTLFPIEASAVIHLLCFIGEQILRPENAELAFDVQKIIAILQFIAKHFEICTGVNLPFADLSEVLSRLLKAKKLEATPELLKAAEDICLYDFCEHVYLRQGNTIAVLSCLLTSLRRAASARPVRNTLQTQDLISRIFVFLRGCLTSPQTGSTSGPLVNRFLESVEIYAQCDPLRCLFLLIHSIGPSMRRILHALDTVFMSDEPLSDSFLNSQSSSCLSSQSFPEDMVAFSAEGKHHPAAICILRPFYELINSDMPELERENAVASVGGDANLRLALDELLSKPDPLVAELYVRLLLSTAGFQDHRMLCDFLLLNCEYRASILLELLNEETYPQELACIYEKIGDQGKATELLKKDFLVHWGRLTDSADESAQKYQALPQEIMSRAGAWFAFAARQCISKRSSENELPWFAIIDTLSELRKDHLSDQLTLWLNDVFHKLLESANSYVPTPALINRVLKHSDTTVADFGSATNKFLLQLVGVWHREVNLMQDCHRLMIRDISSSEQVLVAALKRGIGVRRYGCALCGLSFAMRYRRLRSTVTCRLHTGGFTTLAERNPVGSEIILLWCGHGVHVDCYENCRERLKARIAGVESGGQEYVCLQCNSIIDPSAPPLLSVRSSSHGDPLSSLRIPPPLDIFDEIEVSALSHFKPCPRQSQQSSAHSSQAQRSTNPFGDDN
ncbi:hypothetical protein Aperf_G00000011476 [Anoplocephala perfoliata]